MPVYHFIFLALIMPGFISHYIYTDMNIKIKSKSQLEEVINALIYSLIITIPYGLVILYGFKINNANILMEKFTSITFILFSILFNVGVSILLGMYLYNVEKFYMWFVNGVRVEENKNEITKTDSLLENILDGTDDQAIEIIDKENYTIGKGFIGKLHTSSKEIYIRNIQNIELNRECFTSKDIDGIYFDLNSGIKIVKYKLNRYNEKVKEIEKEFERLQLSHSGNQ